MDAVCKSWKVKACLRVGAFARKRILDTAWKTADAGYSTRRLVEPKQEVVNKEYSCGFNNFYWSGLNRANSTGAVELFKGNILLERPNSWNVTRQSTDFRSFGIMALNFLLLFLRKGSTEAFFASFCLAWAAKANRVIDDR